jgi:hypothetical protein
MQTDPKTLEDCEDRQALSEADAKKLAELAAKAKPSEYMAAFNRPRFAGMIRQSDDGQLVRDPGAAQS